MSGYNLAFTTNSFAPADVPQCLMTMCVINQPIKTRAMSFLVWRAYATSLTNRWYAELSPANLIGYGFDLSDHSVRSSSHCFRCPPCRRRAL